MLERKAYAKLQAWKKESQGKSAILIEGARRVGKSTLVESFAQHEYKSSIVIDFTFAPQEVVTYFEDMRGDLDSFFLYLSAHYGVKLYERDSVIVFDEVQAFPKAREAIKQLVADGRYDYIETGSLVSINSNVQDILIPSEEKSLELQPLDFEEFLAALNQQSLWEAIVDSYVKLTPLPDSLHRKASRFFREYMLVGGMPAAVQEYVNTRDFSRVDELKRDVLRLYRQDISKHAGKERARVASIFESLPGQLSRHEKRFTLSALRKGARTRDYVGAFFWLSDAKITNDCFNATDPSVGLRMSEDRATMKCYMADTGLLVSHAFNASEVTTDGVYRDILTGKLNLNEGMLTENVVAQMLRASGHRLFFYSRYEQSGRRSYEIDFLIVAGYPNAAMRHRVSPVEVKSTTRYGTKSLDKFKERFSSRIGNQFVLHPGQLRHENDRIYLPLYMTALL